MPKGTPITQEDYNIIKYLQSRAKTSSQIAESTGFSESAISRIVRTVDFADFTEKRNKRSQRVNASRAQAKAQAEQVNIAELIPEEQPDVPVIHEGPNRDMLKAIIGTVAQLVIRQDAIIGKLDELIKKLN